MQTNENSQRHEYTGLVLDKAMALLNVTHGGQVLTERDAFHGINSELSSIASSVPGAPEFRLLRPPDAARSSLSRHAPVLNLMLCMICLTARWGEGWHGVGAPALNHFINQQIQFKVRIGSSIIEHLEVHWSS